MYEKYFFVNYKIDIAHMFITDNVQEGYKFLIDRLSSKTPITHGLSESVSMKTFIHNENNHDHNK